MPAPDRRILGIDLSEPLVNAWLGWLAPNPQPFYVSHGYYAEYPSSSSQGRLTPELRDTYEAWNVDDDLEIVWLDEIAFNGLPRSQRTSLVRQQHAGRRGAVPSVLGWSDLLAPALLRVPTSGHASAGLTRSTFARIIDCRSTVR